ncbi:MAG: hypothetical protein AB8H86_26320 [Polyangiales bacterium]
MKEGTENKAAAPKTRWLDDLVLIFAAALTFAVSLTQPLMRSWDDHRFILDFDAVHAYTWDNFVTLWNAPHFEAYQPLHLLSYWLDVPWVGSNGPALHATNIVLWCVALLLVRRTFVALGLRRSAALVATLFFGVHTVQVEVVAWATGRKDIIAAIFSALTVLSYLKSKSWKDRYSLASFVFYLCAALSKTTTLPLPGVLFLIDWLLRERSFFKSLMRHIPMTLVGLALGGVVIMIWTDATMIRANPEGFEHVYLVGATITHKFVTLVAPLANSPLYPIHRTGDFVWFDLLPFVVVPVVIYALRKSPKLLLSVLATGGLLLPVLNIVPVYWENQDRYLSLPLFMFAFGIGALFEVAEAKKAVVARVVAGAFIVLLALRTADYQRAWKDDRALWAHATRVQPEAYYAWLKLGQVRRDHHDYAGARDAYERAIELEPTIRVAYAVHFALLVLIDEEDLDLTPGRSVEFGARFRQGADDVETLRTIASEMIEAGYRDAALYPLARSMGIEPIEDARLARAALVQAELGNEWLARFYVKQMSAAPTDPRLVPYLEE